MKRMKKLFALLMTLAMVMGLGITGFAATNGADQKYGTIDDRGTIAVSGVEEGVTVRAYKIIEAKYENAGEQFSGYNVRYTTNPAITIPSDGSPVEISQTQMDQLEKMDLGTGEPMNWDSESETYKADVAPGTYLVRVTDSETHIYNTMVVSVYYGTNNLNETVLNVSEVNAKKSDHPTINKKVDGVDGNSAEIGDTVTYTIVVNPIPHYSGKYPVFNIVDTLSSGLTYNRDLEVKIGTETFNNYELTTPTPESNQIKIDFVTDDDGYTLNDYTGQSMTITYTATVNASAVVNEDFNNNDARLNYTRDSKVQNEDTYVEDKTYTYTFEIDGDLSGTTGIIDKVGDKTGDTDGLNGATFALYKENPDTNPSTRPFKETTTATVNDKKGQMTFTGLEAGTYYLKEISAPTGYSLNTNVYTIEIAATYYGESDGVAKEDYGKLKSWEVKVDGTTAASFSINNEGTITNNSITGADIKNTTITALPSTGGMGTTLFTIAGCVIMISAAGLFFATRKKAN